MIRYVKVLGSLLGEAFRDWRRDNAQELGAALAYYTVFSIAPLLVIVIALAGLAFGVDAARGEIFTQFRDLMGPDGARALEMAVESASQPRTGVLAVAIGVGALLLGAGGVFRQLQTSLNRIWKAPPASAGWRSMVKSQLVAFAMVLAVGFLLLVSLVVSAGLAALDRWLSGYELGRVALLHAISSVLSFGVITLLFGLMFKFLPAVRIAWRDVWMGAVITAALFSVGREVISLYIIRSRLGAAYGVAGSILVVLGWIYYSSQIFFYGAECTAVWARRFGSGIEARHGQQATTQSPQAIAAAATARRS